MRRHSKHRGQSRGPGQLPQLSAEDGTGRTRTRGKDRKSERFCAVCPQQGTENENGRFQSGNKQEKIYRKIMKKLLQFVKDRVTL